MDSNLIIPEEFEEMDTLAILSCVQKQYEANDKMMTTDDFQSFLRQCDLTGTEERVTQVFDTVQQRFSEQQEKLQETLETILSFNANLDQKIKENPLDESMEIEGIVRVDNLKFAENVIEQMNQLKVMTEKLQEARKAVEDGRVRFEETAEVFAQMQVKLEVRKKEKEEAERKAEEEKAEARKAEEEEETRRKAEEEETRRKAEEEEARRKAEEEEARRKAEEDATKNTEEEAKRKEEEAKRKAEEEEARRKAAEEEKIRRDPRNWSKLVFKDADDQIICVVRAIASENLKMEDLQVTPVDPHTANIKNLGDNDQVISQIVIIQPTEDTKLKFEEPWAVAIRHSAERNPAREPILKAVKADGSWVCKPSQEVQFEDFQDVKFVETRISEPYCTLIAVSAVKTDRYKVGKDGAKISSSVDSRISFSFPSGALHITLDIAMQVQLVESQSFSELKDKEEDTLRSIHTTSHIVNLDTVKKRVSKPVTVTLPVPPKKKQAVTRVTLESSMATRAKGGRYNIPDDGDEEIHLLVNRPDVNKWQEFKDVDMVISKSKDSVSFDLDKVEKERFIAMRTKENTSEESMAKAAQLIDDRHKVRKACFVLRQKVKNRTDVLMQVVPENKLDDVLKNLHEEGYDDEPSPSEVFDVIERQDFEIFFRGNVRLDDDLEDLVLRYNSQLRNRILFTVREKDQFDQRAIDYYHGFAQVYTNMVLKPVAGQSKMVEKEERVVLCELLINIPKIAEPPHPPRRAKFRFKPRDCIDEEFLRHLAPCLTNEWKSLAEELGLKASRIQAIQQNHAQDSSTEDMITDMLLTWVKQTPASTSKAECLADALDRCEESDLAEKVREKQRNFASAKDEMRAAPSEI